MIPFELSIPTRVYFGTGKTAAALYKEKSLLQSKILLVTNGRSLRRLGYVEKIYKILEDIAGVGQVVVFDGVSANPKIEEVSNGIDCGKSFQAEVVVAFGGGSVIDAAKAIAVGIGSGRPIEEFLFEGKVPPKETLPIVALPTTAGTGSELSHGAIITSLQRKIKTGIRGEKICPQVAVVDPQFTWNIPLNITMQTGFDVFAHAMESYVSKAANGFSELLSLEAIRLVIHALRCLSKDLQDKVARENMSYASLLMGVNLAQVGTALPHRMQYPIGAHTDTSHALGLLALYPAWIEMIYPFCTEKMKNVAELIEPKKYSGKESVLKSINGFIEFLDIRKNLSQLGIDRVQIEQLSSEVTGNIANDPVGEKKDIITKIYYKSME